MRTKKWLVILAFLAITTVGGIAFGENAANYISPLKGLLFEQIGSGGLADFIFGEQASTTTPTQGSAATTTARATAGGTVSYGTSPSFLSLSVKSMTVPGLVGNDANGNLLGGQKLTANDIVTSSLLNGKGIVLSGSSLNRLIGSNDLSISLDSNVPTSVQGESNVKGTIEDGVLKLAWDGIISVSRGGTGMSTFGRPGQVLVVNSTGTGLEYRDPSGNGVYPNYTIPGGTVISAIIDGTVLNQTARWDGVNWIGSSALTNDGTDIGVTNNLTVGGNIAVAGTVDGVDVSTLPGQIAGKENAIAAGAAGQYFDGTKAWVTLDTSVVPENGALYFTDARSIGAVLSTFAGGVNAPIVNTDTVVQALDKAQGQIDALNAASHAAASVDAAGNANGLSIAAGQVLTLATATGAQNGALTSADWTRFDALDNALTGGLVSQYLRGDKTWQTLNSDIVPEGLANVYYTSARFDADLATKDTGNLVEGANLYFTEPRVLATVLTGLATNNSAILATDSVLQAFGKTQGQIDAINAGLNENVDDRVAALVQNGTGLGWTYDDVAGTLTGNVTLAPFTTGNLAEGANLYFTDARAEGAILGGYVVGANAAIANTDSIDAAFGKTQGQINALAAASHPAASLVTAANGITFNPGTQVLTVNVADAATDGYLSSGDWTTFNSKQNALVFGDVTTTTAGVNLTGNVGSVIGGGLTVDIQNATGAQNGLLTAADWNTFNSKENAVALGLASQYYRGDKTWQTLDTSVVPENGSLYWTQGRFDAALAAKTTTDLAEGLNLYYTDARAIAAPLTGFVPAAGVTSADTILSAIQTLANNGGHNPATVDAAGTANGLSITVPQVMTIATAGAAQNGALTSADWNTFNNKQNALVIGDTTTSTAGVNLTNNIGSVIGAGLTIDIATADAVNNGLLSSADWTRFDALDTALTGGLVSQYLRGDKTWATLDTSVVPENGNLYYTTARFNADLATKSTTDLAEGANLYYTDARARSSLSVAGAPLQYNNLTGVFSIDQAGVAQDGYLTSADWNTFNNKQNALAFGDVTTTTAGVNLTGNVGSVIGGGLTVDIQDATTAQKGLLTAADWNTFNSKENAVALGLASQYYRGDKTWATLDTSVVPENGSLYWTQGRFDTAFAAKTTTDLAEGLNLYYTDARVDANFATKTTDDLTEGLTNFYYTTARATTDARNAVSAVAPIGYNPATGVFSIAAADTATDGYLTSVDWNTFNNKQNALVFGNVSSPNAAITVTNGAAATVGPNVTIDIVNADGTTTGLLTSADWNTFNNKEDAIVAGLNTEYLRGDKTWATLDTSVVPENGNLYYTDARVSANVDVAANTAARHNAVTIGTANGLSITAGQALSLATASGATTGSLTAADWNTFNNKQNALAIGSVTTGTPGLTITGGNNAVIGGGLTLNIATASAAQNGLLSSANWTTFNNKQNALTFGNISSATPSLTITGGSNAIIGGGVSVSVASATANQTGLLTNADWSTFNNKQNALTFGHGGGVNADMVDGKHATDFLSSTGGTLNGALTTAVTNNNANISTGLTVASTNTAGNGTTGMGTGMTFALENTSGVTQAASEIDTIWTNLNAGTTSSMVNIKTWVNGLYRDALKIDGGALTVPGAYTTTVGAPNRALYVDSTGKIGYLASSERYKNSITNMEDINWLYALRPVNYVYNNDSTGVKQYGLIAEEVDAINQLFVSYNADGTIETVNYNSFIPVLIKAAQDQNTKIEGLTAASDELGLQLTATTTSLDTALATIESQQNEIDALSNSIDNLTNAVANVAANASTPAATPSEPITTTSTDSDIISLTEAINTLNSDVNTIKVDMASFKNAIAINAITGDASFSGHILVNADTAGKAIVKASETKVEITFARAYAATPIVNATPLDFITGQYKISDVTVNGFTIETSEAQADNVSFNWTAFGSN